ncbi:hypothetical protein KP509_31G067100 [Ceratopteris richardii]|nr:hypothetical protein KP509_31G067100 [Ceratopteris richardii]
MRLMNVKGLTLYHLKSHLQKYRLGKQSHKEAPSEAISKSATTTSMNVDQSVMKPTISHTSSQDSVSENMQVSDTLGFQIEVQRKLHEQLEVQRRLQVRIEAQGRYLQSILEKAQRTLAGQTVTNIGLEAARAELSDLASKVSNDCFSLVVNRPCSDAEGGHASHTHERLECSPESCLTSLTHNERLEVDGSNVDVQSGCNKRLKVCDFDGRLRQNEVDIKSSALIQPKGGCSSLDKRSSYISEVMNLKNRDVSVSITHSAALEGYDGMHKQGGMSTCERACTPFHFVGRPEPRRAALSVDQVMGFSVHHEPNRMQGSSSTLNLCDTDSYMAKGIDLNMNNDGNGFERRGFDLN